MECLNCKAPLTHIASDKGLWYYCKTCGTLHIEVNKRELEIHTVPAINYLLAKPIPPTITY